MSLLGSTPVPASPHFGRDKQPYLLAPIIPPKTS